MHIRILSLAVVGALILAACGSDSASRPTAESSTTPTTVAPPTTAGQSSPAQTTSPATPTPPDFTLFIAAVDAALVDTSYAGAALVDPEVFIATGRLFCDLLDDGATADDILTEHLEALAVVNQGVVSDADATATGVVLGASTQVICPQHAP